LNEADVARLAGQLAAVFLAAGNYTFSPSAASSVAGLAPASGAELHDFVDEAGFAGLAVQAVGYEEGAADPRIRVYVTRGRRLEVELPQGVGVVVTRVGKVVVRPEAAATATHRGLVFERRGRIACGSSCAPAGEPHTGTLGALVTKRSRNDLYILSNNHVLAGGNHVAVGMPILVPSPGDASPTTRAPAGVARHAEICELRSGVPALVPAGREDLAIARVDDAGKVSSWQGDQDGYDTPTRTAELRAGLPVKKVGRTTGLTTGVVEARIHTPFALPYRCRLFNAVVWLQDAWTVRTNSSDPFALPGDSGSLVVTDDGEAAAGVVFAASTPDGELGYIIPMNHVVQQFGGLTLVGRHNV